MPITLISACDKNKAIGVNNKLLCHLPNDLKHFKEITQNSICIMGKNTYHSIIDQLGKPLPNRTTIVLSSDTSYVPPCHLNPDVYVYISVDALLNDYRNHRSDERRLG